MGFDFTMFAPLLPSHVASLSLDIGYLFLSGFHCSPVNGCLTTSCDFGALAGGDECTSFYSTILNWTLRTQIFRAINNTWQ